MEVRRVPRKGRGKAGSSQEGGKCVKGRRTVSDKTPKAMMRIMVTMMTIRTTFGDICHLYSSWMLLLNHLEAPHKLMV